MYRALMAYGAPKCSRPTKPSNHQLLLLIDATRFSWSRGYLSPGAGEEDAITYVYIVSGTGAHERKRQENVRAYLDSVSARTQRLRIGYTSPATLLRIRFCYMLRAIYAQRKVCLNSLRIAATLEALAKASEESA